MHSFFVFNNSENTVRSIRIDLHQVTNQINMTSIINSTCMKRMLTLAMAVLCIALYPVSAQKSEVNENDKYYKAREIIDAKGDLNKAAELLRDNVKRSRMKFYEKSRVATDMRTLQDKYFDDEKEGDNDK